MKEHFCSAEQSIITYQGKCNWCGEKETLAQTQEPVAWWNDTGTHIDLNVSGRGTPLYTTPPQRTWVGLTANELSMIGDSMKTWNSFSITDVYFAIEARLKEKNCL